MIEMVPPFALVVGRDALAVAAPKVPPPDALLAAPLVGGVANSASSVRSSDLIWLMDFAAEG
jgi:hypothetical protein